MSSSSRIFFLPFFINGFSHQNEIVLNKPALENGVTLSSELMLLASLASSPSRGAWRTSQLMCASLSATGLFPWKTQKNNKITPREDETFETILADTILYNRTASKERKSIRILETIRRPEMNRKNSVTPLAAII